MQNPVECVLSIAIRYFLGLEFIDETFASVTKQFFDRSFFNK